MIAAENIAGRIRALCDLVGEDLAGWLDADPDEVFRLLYEPEGLDDDG